ncbi:MAG: HAD family hydrolase [Maribacter sp.]
MSMDALIFDCDGVLVDTERDGHRVAFNKAFEKNGLPVEWSIQKYEELLKIGGGKERMKAYFDKEGYPGHITDKENFIKALHIDKTELFMELIRTGSLPVRPGVQRIIDEALGENISVLICSTSNVRPVTAIAEELVGMERRNQFKGIFAGDMAKLKKPDPEIYNLAKKTLGLDPSKCVVIEDSRNGLLAAKAAGMNCLVTLSTYTQDEDMKEADNVVPDLENNGNPITLSDLKQLIPEHHGQ